MLTDAARRLWLAARIVEWHATGGQCDQCTAAGCPRHRQAIRRLTEWEHRRRDYPTE